ncbi:RHS repeat-associated core domain-containing protein [Streptomyces sp. NPDC003737]|uniref:RHS repeat-associated core domain-containing protein n=1 Tax=Streptomyces sp. NPDC003737 TaxID=3364685 RepID=UPI0036935D97
MAFGIGTSRRPVRGAARQHSGRLLVQAVTLALVVPLGLAQVAEAQGPGGSGGIGRPHVPKPRVSKVKVLDGPGAKKARQKVARDKQANIAQAQRARTERKAAWPQQGEATLSLAPGKTGTVSPAGVPVTLSLGAGKASKDQAAVQGTARVTVLNQKAARKAGITGVLLTAESDRAGAARVVVDYSGFASAIGGGWAQRLSLVQLPACALTTPQKMQCRKATPLTSNNDISHQTLSAQVNLAAAPGARSSQPAHPAGANTAQTVLAVTAATSTAGSGPAPSGTGNYSATPLSASSSWQAGGSSGAFTWSYDFTAPPAAAGPVPALSLSYDSGSIDGRTATTNNQGTPVGEGFALTESYIERTYGSCDEDGHADLLDLCWKYDNARLVLNGKSTRLVKDDDNGTWRLEDDDASKVTRSAGASNGDDNGEYWTITTGDGTKYVFGQDKLDGADTQRTNSAWTVAVFGDDSGEPGYSNGDTFDKRSTVQAWRWNLDYVEDLDGNAATYWYTKESNYYKKNKATTASSYYIRGGYLDRIEYGLRKSALFTDKADAKVTFGYTERCTAADCSSLTKDTAQNWPDVPFDAICAKDNADCNATSPSFFTRKRLTGIATSSYNTTTGAYDPVDSWAFVGEYLDGGDIGDSSDQVLTLKSLTRTGKAGDTSIALKPISFTYQMRSNRVDATDNILPMTRPRISTVTSDTGAITRVTLSAPECVRSEVLNAAPDTNTRSCYPQYWHINGAENASIDWFHKYRVLAVTVADPAANNEAVEYAYSYSGAAWHYADDPITPKDERTWSDWRGYRQITAWTGATDVTRSKSVSLYLQGMDGDKNQDGTTKSVPVAPLATPSLGAASIPDSDQYAGQLREQVTFDGATAISATVNDLWSQETARQSPPDAGDHVARYVRTKKTHNYTYLTASGTWRERQTETSFDSYGMPVTVDDYGQIGKGSDETCTRTWYARNTDLGITSLASRTRTVARQCSTVDTSLSLPATSATSGDVLSDTATVYDTPNATGWTSTQKPTKGQVTWTGRATGYAATADVNGDRLPASWQAVATTTYDTLGRPLSVTDNAGHTTSTAYTPVDAGPLTKTITTGPEPMQYKAVSFLDPRRGLALRSYDINLQKTEQKYDALGRLTNVWLPNRDSSSQSPNLTFDYHLDNTKPSWVSTAALKSDGNTYNTSYAIYDALLRPLQTQVPTPLGGRLLTDTRYDTRGLAYESYADIYDTTSTPNGTYTRAEYGEAPQQTETVFDGAGRGTTSTLNVFGKEKWSTTTSYTGDSVATTALEGGSAQRTITDVRGRTVESREYAGTDPADSDYGTSPGTSYTSTRFTYGLDGRQDTITGPDNTKWTYVYDLFGRQIRTTDPDKGTTTTEYNALDQVIKSTDSLQQSVLTDYDELGRITGTWSGSKTEANQLTAHTYDSVHKGLPTSSTRYVGGKATGDAYTQTVTAYDSLDRATNTQLELPADDPFVKAGQPSTLAFETYYKIDGTLNGTKEPAAGGLPSEAIDYHYDGLGDLTSFGGATGYLDDVTYSQLAQPLQLTLGTGGTGNKYFFVNNTFEEGTGRLTRSNVTDQTHPYMLQDLNYTYDKSGNVTAISDPTTLGGTSSADTQCFAYDGHQRLLEAWTPTSQKCTDAPAAASLSGPAPYWTSYTYNTAGQRATETTHTTSGNTKTTYCYTDTKQPHTLRGTTTGTDCTTPQRTYDYDTTGNTTKRPGQNAGHQQDLAWSPEGQLTKLTEDDKSTDYVYDANGNLLIRATENGERILYAGSTELHLRTDGTTWAQRYYTAAGITAAMRSNQTGASKLTYLAADQHGTSSLTISPDTSQTYTKRYTTPFGEDRGAPLYGPWPDDKGFLGKTRDAATGLTHIGAREYDPTIGQFLSVDPILDTSNAQSLNGYAYANNNPATFSDPTGQWLDDGTGHSESPTGNNRDDVGVPRGGTHAGGSSSSGGGIKDTTRDATRESEKQIYDAVNDLAGSDKQREAWFRAYRSDMQKVYAKEKIVEANTAIAKAVNVCYVHKDLHCSQQMLDYFEDVEWTRSTKVGLYEDSFGGPMGALAAEKTELGRALSARCFHSFVEGTKVQLADGSTKPIQDVKVGDKVTATDPETGETSTREVAGTIVTKHDKHFVKVTVVASGDVDDSKGSLTATETHPFWSPSSGGWINGGDLRVGMTLRTPDGHSVEVLSVRHFTHQQVTYDLTVGGLHTYYVLAGETPVLVHNSSCPTSAADGERLRRQLAEEAGQLPGIRSADDIFDTPSALSGGVTPDQVRPFFAGRKGWVEEGLGRGKNAGGGWVIREYTGRGDPTGRMLRWNPGGGHHGEGAYWRVVGPEGDLGGIIR